MLDWLIRNLIKLKVKLHPEWLATGGISISEKCDVDIIVNRYYNTYMTSGTKRIDYPKCEPKEEQNMISAGMWGELISVLKGISNNLAFLNVILILAFLFKDMGGKQMP